MPPPSISVPSPEQGPAIRNRSAGCNIRTSIPASFDAIEQLFADFRSHCACVRVHADCFAAELLLREALTNAVVHGCQNDPAKRVNCAVRMKGSRLTISVEDPGPGFNWRQARVWEADTSSCSGRGMEIFRKYATRFRFNTKGNSVTVVKDFDLGSSRK